LWRGASDAYKAKYARNIWAQFEERTRSSAYTASLPRFLEALCSKMQVEIRTDDLASVHSALSEYDPHATLSALRGETTALVVLVRLRNEERKSDFEKKKSERLKERELNEDLLSEGDSNSPLFNLA
jgi:hypothetical protein